MSDDTRRILDLLAQEKITVDEADELLRAAREREGPAASGTASAPAGSDDRPRPKFLRVEVHKAASQWRHERQVAIKVPLTMVRGGMRLGALIPGTGDRIQQAMRDRGINFDFAKLDAREFETMLRDMGELNIDVDNGRAQVRVTCE